MTNKDTALIRLQCQQRAITNWRRELEREDPSGKRMFGAIRPYFGEWLEARRKGGIIFHMAQVLTGHGCFGEYLCRIVKERSARCHHCDKERNDTADHTLAECPAWETERMQLKKRIGNNLTLPVVIEYTIREEEAWKAFATFCGRVMRKKEDAERVRRGEQPPPPSSSTARDRDRACIIACG